MKNYFLILTIDYGQLYVVQVLPLLSKILRSNPNCVLTFSGSVTLLPRCKGKRLYNNFHFV